MTIPAEELPRLLELAARAIGLKFRLSNNWHDSGQPQVWSEDKKDWIYWNPLESSDQCAEMNAALNHDTEWRSLGGERVVYIGPWFNWKAPEHHDGTTQGKLAAWREASLRAAAKRGEMRGEEEANA